MKLRKKYHNMSEVLKAFIAIQIHNYCRSPQSKIYDNQNSNKMNKKGKINEIYSISKSKGSLSCDK